jgi:hypothetical protein
VYYFCVQHTIEIDGYFALLECVSDICRYYNNKAFPLFGRGVEKCILWLSFAQQKVKAFAFSFSFSVQLGGRRR